MKSRKVRLLYLIYNENLLHSGILRSQVIKLLERLSERPEIEKICLLSFVNPNSLRRSKVAWNELSPYLESKDIELKLSPMFFPIRWNFLAILLATTYCLPILFFTSIAGRYNVIHTRSYVAGLLGQLLRQITGIIHIFDPRGPMPEEMAHSGIWRKGSRTYKFWKRAETKIITSCSAIIAVTPGYKQQFRERNANKAVFIPNRGDIEYFIKKSNSMVIGKRPRFLFIGSTWNSLDLIVSRYSILRSKIPELQLHIITHMDPNLVIQGLIKAGMGENDWKLESSTPEEIPEKISGASFGYLITSIKQVEGVWPVKVAEYLACGIPLAIEEGVGDHLTSLVRKWKIGIVVGDKDDSFLSEAVELIKIMPEYSERCREFAKKRLDISRSADQYLRLYKQELKRK